MKRAFIAAGLIALAGCAAVTPTQVSTAQPTREAKIAFDITNGNPVVVNKTLETISAEEGCRADTEQVSWVPPARMNAEQMAMLEAACQELGREPARLWSGAGHDAAILCRHVPTGMLFVPSIGGISHSPHETTSDEHLVLGARALLRGVRAAAARIK